MRASHHPLEQERLATLRDYDVLDSQREKDFDDIVDLASQICETPISVINLIDEDRQWFKAEVGLNASETPLETSICAHAILENDFVEIEDTLADDRMADNPLCTATDGLRFYAGSLLIDSNGLPLGTLCVLDYKPRRLTDLQRKTLRVLSRQVMKLLDLRVALRNQAILQAETDHRVKNSLQSMSAIVRVYSRTIKDPAAAEALAAIQRRVDAMASLHKELQDSAGQSTIDARTYLTQVLKHLDHSTPENINIRTHIDTIVMQSDEATNLGLIISEFVANSIKHAFPDDRPGEISVSVTVLEPGRYRLECLDNGIGDAGRDADNTASSGIGLSLIAAAVSNLGGTLQSDLSPDGSQMVMEFGAAPIEEMPQLVQRPAE